MKERSYVKIDRCRVGITLLELLVSLCLIGIIVLAISNAVIFTMKQTHVFMDRYNMHAQMGYVLDDMQLRCPTATDVKTTFKPNDEYLYPAEFIFQGEKDIFNVTPDNTSDNIWYRYRVNEKQALVLDKSDTIEGLDYGRSEVLIEGKYNPQIVFSRKTNSASNSMADEPDYMTVTIKTTMPRKNISGISRSAVKLAGIRFWFTNVVE